MNTKSRSRKPGRQPDLALPRVEYVYQAPEVLETGVELPDKARQYLEALSRTGFRTYAASAVGVPYQTVWRWRRDLDGFAAEEEKATEGILDALERVTFKSSISGEHVPSSVARQRMFLLERLRPGKYGKPAYKREVTGSLELNVKTDWLTFLREGVEEADDAAESTPTGDEVSGGEAGGDA